MSWSCYFNLRTEYVGEVLVLALAVARVVVNTLLAYYGVRFLSYTMDLKDFILNSLALGSAGGLQGSTSNSCAWRNASDSAKISKSSNTCRNAFDTLKHFFETW